MVRPDRSRLLEAASNSGSGLDVSDGGMRMGVVEVDVRTPCAPAHRVWPRALIERHIRHRGEVCRCAPPWQGFAQRSSTQTPEQYMCWNSVSLLPAVSSRERRGAVSIMCEHEFFPVPAPPEL